MGWDVEHPFIVEGLRRKYNPDGTVEQENASGEVTIEIPYTDGGNADGDTTKIDTNKTSHQKFDLVLGRKGADGMPDFSQLAAVDYKSSLRSTYHAIPQMMYYAALAQKIDEESLRGTLQQPEFKDIFSGFGDLVDVNGVKTYVPRTKRLFAYTGTEGGKLLDVDVTGASNATNKKVANEMYSILMDAASKMRYDFTDLTHASPVTAAILEEAEGRVLRREVREHMENLQNDQRTYSDEQSQFFLSRYSSDIEQLNSLRSDIYRDARRYGNVPGGHFSGTSMAAIRERQ